MSAGLLYAISMAHLLGVGINRREPMSADLRDLLGIRLTVPVEHKQVVLTHASTLKSEWPLWALLLSVAGEKSALSSPATESAL